ncbi:hypothetical protein JD844_004439 [Phrynosoma platyrhinos]|uniref:Amidase domain-containing protein n=1 Tax=Phrynosoma platyrhinos TaxID=52577 RepID=A0ABQ7TMU0_PHRPL|nr:hypothetical protein JD844_004439 [Phrynosoma platyrhinos]
MALSRGERCLVLVLRCLSCLYLALLRLVARASSAAAASASSPPKKALDPGGPPPAPLRLGRRCVPPPEQPLLLLSAAQLAQSIRRRQVSCVDVIETYIGRIKQVNPLINALVRDRFEAALQEAHQVDKLLSEGHDDEETLREKFPFLGVPVTIKEAFALHGGEGCILAAAGSVIGIGSDIGGSIRMPAFFNGIFGHKPTTGVVPNEGQFPNAFGIRTNFLCTGPMCRYSEDLEPMLRVMAGPNIAKEILQAHRKVVKHLETDLGVQVQNVAIRDMKYSFQIWSVMMSSKDSSGQETQAFTDLLGDHGKPVWPSWELVKWTMGMSSHTLPAIAIFNILGLPVTQCPLGLSKERLPLGIQVVAGPHNDHLTLAVARYLEKAFGGWVPPGTS